MSIWRKTKTYLGLGPDEDYMDSGEHMSQAPVIQQPSVLPPQSGYGSPEHGMMAPPSAFSGASVRTIPSATAQPQPQQAGTVPGVPAQAGVAPLPAARGATVRTIPASSARSKPEVVAPQSFNDAQRVADTFKANKAVIVNLQAVNSDLSRRIIDFAAGLCYGLGGQMEKVTQAVYMLTPDDVEVSAEDRRDFEQGLN